MLRPNELVIDDSNYLLQCGPVVDGKAVRRGAVPRDFSVQPRPMEAVQFPLIPRSEWSARIKELEETKSALSHLRMTANGGQPAPSLDQGQKGYCWAHSTTNAVQLLRFKAMLPYVPLSAYAVACKIKNFRDEGGWCGLSMQFAIANGIPSQALWPQGDMSRGRDVAATWADAAGHKVTESWYDSAAAVYDQELTFDQVATLLLNRVPVAVDFNWWGHSVCALDLVETSPNEFGLRIWNSWGDSWGTQGTGVLAGSKAVPDGACAPLVTNG